MPNAFGIHFCKKGLFLHVKANQQIEKKLTVDHFDLNIEGSVFNHTTSSIFTPLAFSISHV